MLGIFLIYLIFFIFVGIAALLIIPKAQYKKFFLYGFLFGGLGNATIAALLSSLNLIDYRNLGPFNVFNFFSIWTPLTWALVFALFFYLLPVRKFSCIPTSLPGWPSPILLAWLWRTSDCFSTSVSGASPPHYFS